MVCGTEGYEILRSVVVVVFVVVMCFYDQRFVTDNTHLWVMLPTDFSVRKLTSFYSFLFLDPISVVLS